MNISNSDLKALLTLHNFLPQYKEEQKCIDTEYIKAITRYEKVLIKLLQQKLQENEETRLYLELKTNKNSLYGSTAQKGSENHG